MMTRRNFLSLGLGWISTCLLFRPQLTRGAFFPQFFFTQIRYRGGEWDPNPQFVEPIIEELEIRTSIDGAKERRVATLSDPDLFYFPFLYLAGKYDFDPFTPQERERLKRFLTAGGFLLAEDVMGAKGFGFDRAFRREMNQIFPDSELKRLLPDHPLYQSFYLLHEIGGRQRVNPYVEGIEIQNWTPVIYTQNDLAGAWAKDPFGKWVYECSPGGEAQRASAFKTGINLIVYSLTADYKKDLVHHPFIRKRLNQ
jgi:hypothetical protein